MAGEAAGDGVESSLGPIMSEREVVVEYVRQVSAAQAPCGMRVIIITW